MPSTHSLASQCRLRLSCVQGDEYEKEDEHDKAEPANALLSISSGGGGPGSSSPASRKEGASNWLAAAAPARGLRAGSQITLKQGDDILGHGYMLDSEPEVGDLFVEETHPVPEPARIPTHWPKVKITSVGRGAGSTQISQDSVFAADGTVFDHDAERSLNQLSDLDEVIIWHDFVFPRELRVKPRKSVGKKKRRA